jgi:transcriptional regulator with XRE-family HTH domain
MTNGPGPIDRQVSAFWFDVAMSITRKCVRSEVARRSRRLHLQAGEEIRRLRLDAGVSVADLANTVGVHRSYLPRIEAGQARPSIEVLSAIGIALGADLSLRYFAGSGPRLHDRFQAEMIETVLRRLDLRWRPEIEVVVDRPSRGIVDLVLTDRATPTIVVAEAQSELRRLEQQVRWATEKAHGLAGQLAETGSSASGSVVSRLLILRSTIATRELARRYASTLAAAYPARTADVIRALTTSGSPWPGPGIVWVRIEGGRGTLLDRPPRGVALGR